MRRRIGVPSVLAVLATLVTATGVRAAPLHNHGLTIAATPNLIQAGEAVLIYGQLNTKPVGGQTITLYHHIAGKAGYTRVGKTTTDATGFYEFTRAESIVVSNRSWYVKAAGAKGVHSRTVNERVLALVKLAASTSTGETGKPIVFSGSVLPNHAGEKVLLQKQVGTGWKTLESALLGPGSRYAIHYGFRIPGAYDLRVRAPGDSRTSPGSPIPRPSSSSRRRSRASRFTPRRPESTRALRRRSQAPFTPPARSPQKAASR